jgi:hypothetical protein
VQVAQMRELSKLPENCRCADCDAKGPWPLLDCSSRHREPTELESLHACRAAHCRRGFSRDRPHMAVCLHSIDPDWTSINLGIFICIKVGRRCSH